MNKQYKKVIRVMIHGGYTESNNLFDAQKIPVNTFFSASEGYLLDLEKEVIDDFKKEIPQDEFYTVKVEKLEINEKRLLC